jgi:hypothetical protein
MAAKSLASGTAREFLEPFGAPSVLLDESVENETGVEGADGMQVLKDAATLGILILLALTVRVDLNGRPIDLDTAPRGDAAVDQPVPLDLRPAFISQPAHAAQPAPVATESRDDSPLVVTRHIALPVLPGTSPTGPEETERREFVWEVDGQRIVIVLGVDPPAKASSPSESVPEPCEDTLRARLSC